MPRYLVKEKGFYNGHLYDPAGKRPILEVDKPFTKKNPMPSWVTDMSSEPPELKAKRKAQEASAAAAIDSLTESLDLAKNVVEKATKTFESAKSDDSKATASTELTRARVELQNIQTRLNSLVEPEATTQDQVSTASSDGDGKETSFLGKVKDVVGMGDKSSKVETL